jgi:hypothetical protein
MDTLRKTELESMLSSRLPQCTIACSLSWDGTLSVEVTGPKSHQYTITGINRSLYRGEQGINKLVREIMEEMVISRSRSSPSLS